MADLQQLGDLFAAGFGSPVNRNKSYMEGMALRDTSLYRNAQTENALAQARVHRDTAVAKEREAEALKVIKQRAIDEGGLDPRLAAQLEIGAQAGLGNWDQLSQGALNVQEFGNRGTLADVLAPRDVQLAAAEAIQGKPVERFYQSGTGMQASQLDPAAAPTVTPVGQASITADAALAAQRNASNAATGGLKFQKSGNVLYVETGDPVQPLRLALPAETQAYNLGTNAAGVATGKATGAAQASLPDTLLDINKMRGNVQGLLNAPGFDTIYGLSGKTDPRNLIPGTDAANAEAKRRQLDAESFGVAIQKMRGLGHLSNAEGLKVTDAFTRATNKNISDTEARTAWGEVLDWLQHAETNAYLKAQGLPSIVKLPDRAPGSATGTQTAPATNQGATEGARGVSKSGKPMVFMNGQWEYE